VPKIEPYPTLRTERLIHREFTQGMAPDVQRLVGDWEVIRTLLGVTYPYKDGMAEEWIATHRPTYEAGERVTWAIVLRVEKTLIGSITLHLHPIHDNAELGYWIGRPYWGCGYATEAAREVVRHGFEDLGLHRIGANHLGSNPASGKVMRKIRMTHEGTRPEHYKQWGGYEDRVEYGLLARDWRASNRG
jgi:[ribosomal protein S5]-alanine N-acetyltransferase